MNDRNDNLNEVIDERVKVYGDPTVTFPQIAQVWSGILGHEVKGTDVPLMLIGMKLVRTVQAPDYSDNSDDVEGYLDIFRKLVGDSMVHARSVDDFVEQKAARQRASEHEDKDYAQLALVIPELEPERHYDSSIGLGTHTHEVRAERLSYWALDVVPCRTANDHILATRHSRENCPLFRRPGA